MAWCVAPGCHNSSANSSVLFHALPDKKKNPSKYNAWYAAIEREILPARGKLCSDHFTPDCMELSPLMKLSVGADLYKEKAKMIIRLGFFGGFCGWEGADSTPFITSELLMMTS